MGFMTERSNESESQIGKEVLHVRLPSIRKEKKIERKQEQAIFRFLGILGVTEVSHTAYNCLVSSIYTMLSHGI